MGFDRPYDHAKLVWTVPFVGRRRLDVLVALEDDIELGNMGVGSRLMGRTIMH